MLHQSPGSKRIVSFTRIALFSLVLLLTPYGVRAEVDTPDTPAGHTLRAFLDAFNSADHDRIAELGEVRLLSTAAFDCSRSGASGWFWEPASASLLPFAPLQRPPSSRGNSVNPSYVSWPSARHSQVKSGPPIESANRSVLQRGTAMSGRGKPSAACRTSWWESREYEVGRGHDRRPVRSRSTQGRFAMAAQPELDVP